MQSIITRGTNLTSSTALKNNNSIFARRIANTTINGLFKFITTAPNTVPQSLSTMSEASSQNEQPPTSVADKVYVQRSSKDKDMMRIAFQYTYNGRSRQFNLNRKSSEPLSTSLDRIKLNLLKLTNQKIKKKGGDLETQQPANGQPDSVNLTIGGTSCDPISTLNNDAWVEGAVLDINGTPYQVRTNEPQVESIILPSCIMKNFITMPNVSLVNCSIENCQFTWFRKISAREREMIINKEGIDGDEIEFDGFSYWYRLSNDMTYCPTNEDLAHYLKIVCQPSDGTKVGPKSEQLSSGPVEMGPLYCPFEKRHEKTKAILSGPQEFRFITYNILADLYADSDYSRTVLFGHCPAHALEIGYRRQILLKEILGYNADLICLQEVDKKEFIRTYEPFFKVVGQCSGVYDTKGGQVAEGLATFYRDDKFELIHSHKTLLTELIEPQSACQDHKPPGVVSDQSEEPSAEQIGQVDEVIVTPHLILGDRNSPEAKQCLSKFDELRSAILSNQELKKRFAERKTVLQATLLKSKGSTDRYILVANTHLYFAPDADHIRLLQGCVCVKYLEYLKNVYRLMLTKDGHSEPNISAIFCGDMNSTPDCGLYKLLTKGEVTPDLPDWSSNKEEAIDGLSVEIGLRFSSAYENIEYTNYTPGFKGCLDYIYYERDRFTCQSTVPLPDHEAVTAIGGIPSDVFPSDHLALIANLIHT